MAGDLEFQLKVDLKDIVKNLRGSREKIAHACEKGLIRGGVHLLRQSVKEVPVDTGILRSGAFAKKAFGSGFDTDVQVGYVAAYSIYVHENLDNLHGAAFNAAYAKEIAMGLEHTRGENQKAKFLEDPMKRERQNILMIIKTTIISGVK